MDVGFFRNVNKEFVSFVVNKLPPFWDKSGKYLNMQMNKNLNKTSPLFYSVVLEWANSFEQML